MDLSSLVGSLMGNTQLVSALEDQAVKHGVPPAVVSEFTQGAQQIIANGGKIDKDALVKQLAAHAEAKGVPAAVVDKAIAALGSK